LPDWDLLFANLLDAERAGLNTAWLALDMPAYDQIRRQLPSAAIFEPADDAATQCWRAIAHILGA
jgi:hypothetical protein